MMFRKGRALRSTDGSEKQGTNLKDPDLDENGGLFLCIDGQ